MGEQKYKELDNYHYVVTTYDDTNLISKEESWYKEGISKTINSTYVNGNPQEMITYLDYQNNIGYILDGNTNMKLNIDVKENFDVY